MGYDVTWYSTLRLKQGVNVEQVKKDFEKACQDSRKRMEEKKSATQSYDLDGIHDWEDELTFEADGNLDFGDYGSRYHEGSWYELNAFLAPLVEEGTVEFKGEDDAIWRHYFDGKGKWQDQLGTVLYDYEPFKTFINKFDKDLPDELKKELKKWYKGIKVRDAI